MKRGNSEITCENCGISDLNCYEQCKDDKCIGCFGASMNDCEICDEREARAKEEVMETVELTKDEAKCVRWFIEDYLFTVIRDDIEIDNFNWLIEITNVYKKCKYLEKGGDNEAE